MRARKRPRKREGAEIILGHLFVHNLDFSDELTPAFHLLANVEGFRWLADWFLWLAGRDPELLGNDGDGEHEHLRHSEPPLNSRLSDEVDVVARMFDDRTRKKLLKRQGITKKIRNTGDPITQFSKLLDELDGYVREVPTCDETMRRQHAERLRALHEKLGRLIAGLKAEDQSG